MKTPIVCMLLGALGIACVSLTKQGAQVRVYQADVETAEAPAPPLPDGCRLLKTWGPIDQQQQEREISDPYLSQRNQTAALGGNVLYLRSYRFRNLMKTDCSVGDKSPGCMDNLQSWYKVTFGSYACDAPALAELAAAPQPANAAIFRWELKKKTPAPEEPKTVQAAPAAAPTPSAAPIASVGAASLKSKIVALLQEGVGADVIVAYVRANRLASPLTAEEIIDWKRSGIPDEVIRATFSN